MVITCSRRYHMAWIWRQQRPKSAMFLASLRFTELYYSLEERLGMKKCRQKHGGFWALLTPLGTNAWYLRLQVFTTDQPRCYVFDKLLRPPGFRKNIYGFLVLGTKSSRKIFSFSLVDVGTCKNNEKMFLLTGKS